MTLRIVTFKIEEELLEKVDKLALKLGVSRSTIIRWAIEYYLEQKSQDLEQKLRKRYVEVIKI